jgi:hypothetical protein
MNKKTKGQGTIEAPFRKSCTQKSIAQGTIEYLVIIAVVVVIGLTVSSLIVSTNNTNQINTTTDKIDTQTKGGITVTESYSDFEEENILTLRNNSPETKTLKKITTGETENPYNTRIQPNQTIQISTHQLDCICQEGQKTRTCQYELEYESEYGITTKENQEITIECLNEITTKTTPTHPDIDLEGPQITILSPITGNHNESPLVYDTLNQRAIKIDFSNTSYDGIQTFNDEGIIDFNFLITDDSNIESCNLLLNQGWPTTSNWPYISDSNILIGAINTPPFNVFSLDLNSILTDNTVQNDTIYIDCNDEFGNSSSKLIGLFQIQKTNSCISQHDNEYPSQSAYESYCCNEENIYHYEQPNGDGWQCLSTIGGIIVACRDPVEATHGDNYCGLGENPCISNDCPKADYCNNGTCEFNSWGGYTETVASCPADCSCGDNVCSPDENINTCPSDCTCGNDICEGDEWYTCESDCEGYEHTCGDDICGPEENNSNCASDCSNVIVLI